MSEIIKTNNQAVTAKSLFAKDDVKAKFNELLGKKAQGFITSVLQIVNNSSLLKNADPMSIYNAAATAATLDLPINNNLGFAYIIPYNQSYKDENGNWGKKAVAQFQLGYKGFIQLAQRSGQFKTISATAIYEGQLISSNPLTGFEFDFTKKTSEKIIGFAAYFKLINGFEKMFYMTNEEMKAHGSKFSMTYSKSDSIWQKDPIGMGNKTVLKLLLSKFAPLSIEMQKAIITDQAVVTDFENNEVDYIDNEHEEVEIDHEKERITLMLQDCASVKEVDELVKNNPNIPSELVTTRKDEIKQGKLL